MLFIAFSKLDAAPLKPMSLAPVTGLPCSQIPTENSLY